MTMGDRTNPLDGLEELLERLNRQLETAVRSWESEFGTRSHLDLSVGESAIRLDLADHGDSFVVTVDVPGFETDDLETRLRGETLEISGEREQVRTPRREIDDEPDTDDEVVDEAEGDGRTQQADATAEYIRREREVTSFSRRIRLPEPVDVDGVTASLNNGILTVTIPKRDLTSGSHTIDIE